MTGGTAHITFLGAVTVRGEWNIVRGKVLGSKGDRGNEVMASMDR